jgi:DNA invertase Pin-like site-specific DNA recombinase
MTRLIKKRGVLYARRSGSKQETSLETQLSWAIGEAKKHGVTLNVSLADLEHMRANRLHRFGDMYLDDAISGADMDRPGFCALVKDMPTREEVSHVFAYKRDRLGRPDQPLSMMVLEQGITDEGITIVFNDGIAQPTRRGQTDLSHMVQMLFGYHQSGEFLRQLAERVIDAQRHLARQGFRTGGNAPYGFGRFLLDPSGNVVEELAAGRYVRQAGHHVVIRINNPEKIAIWVYILDLKHQGWGFKRIAAHLNDLGIPSPDAGKERTDQGVRHAVSGMWSPNTIASLCSNKAIIGMQDYGRRSEGAHRRLGDAGPRVLQESDNTLEGKPRVILNDPGVRISAPLRDEPASFDVQKWREINAQMDARGQNQRGVRRAKDPAKYPLACIVFDLTDGCGSVMYGTTVGARIVYRCGRYMRTAGSQCRQNSADGRPFYNSFFNCSFKK